MLTRTQTASNSQYVVLRSNLWPPCSCSVSNAHLCNMYTMLLRVMQTHTYVHVHICGWCSYMAIQLSPAVSEKSCDRQVVCFSPAPMYSPTNSFLQLTHTSSTELRVSLIHNDTHKCTRRLHKQTMHIHRI